MARPTVGAVGRVTAPTGKTGWRSKPAKRPTPQPPVDQEEAVPEIAQDVAEEIPETPNAAPDDDLVLEQEPDDADVADLVGHDVEEPKER